MLYHSILFHEYMIKVIIWEIKSTPARSYASQNRGTSRQYKGILARFQVSRDHEILEHN